MSKAFISDPQWAGWEDIRHMRSTGVWSCPKFVEG